MVPIVGVGLVLPGDEVGRVLIILDQPAAPQILDAFLIAGRADDAKSMEVDRSFDSVRRLRLLAIDHDRVSFQQQIVQQIFLVLFRLDDLLRKHFTSSCSHSMQVLIPGFK